MPQKTIHQSKSTKLQSSSGLVGFQRDSFIALKAALCWRQQTDRQTDTNYIRMQPCKHPHTVHAPTLNAWVLALIHEQS